MDLEKLIIKRDKLKNELYKLNDKIGFLTPEKIMMDYDSNYNCPYCGEIPKKYCRKHKCGQMLDWSEFIEKENRNEKR